MLTELTLVLHVTAAHEKVEIIRGNGKLCPQTTVNVWTPRGNTAAIDSSFIDSVSRHMMEQK